MLLVGMFDSPYVRRVALSMRTLGIPFEHANWSVGKDQARIAELNPLGQVPVLVLDDGEALFESAMILDYLDQRVGPERALVPVGDVRRRVLGVVALALGVADKARLLAYEKFFRPAGARHEPYRVRLHTQMVAAARELDRASAGESLWLFGDAITQADITLASAVTYAIEAVQLPVDELPALRARNARLAQQPVFREIYEPFDAPIVT
jgi:glutathione S-transferase